MTAIQNRERVRHGSTWLWGFKLGLAMLLGGCAGAPPELGGGGAGGGPEGVVADELIVTLRPGAGADDVAGILSTAGVSVRDQLEALAATLVEVDPSRRDDARNELEQSDLVEGVDDNQIVGRNDVPNDELYPSQWHLATIHAEAAWARTTGSEQVVVAVLDSGVDTGHPDLVDKLRNGGNTYNGGGWHDVTGHGTAVAGVIGATSWNQQGAASIAPLCPILAVRVTDEKGLATSWSLAAGIALAVESGAKVINVSFEPQNNDDLVIRQAELARLAGALVIMPTGNSGVEVVGRASEHVLFVGATGANDELASFSSYGTFVDLVAPGVNIQTTRLGSTYGTVTGTSYAAPVVAGVAALAWTVNPQFRPVTVEGILLASATDLGNAGDDTWFGAGRVDAGAAVALAEATVELLDDTPPAVNIVRPAGSNTPLQGTEIVEVAATDAGGVAEVSLLIDDVPVASDVLAPYSFAVRIDHYSVGTHTLRAVATDIAGNSGEARLSATFAGVADHTRPALEILSPGADAIVTGTITILAQAVDDRALSRAEVLVDHVVITTLTLTGMEARVAANWNTASADVASGAHTLTVKVYDGGGNVTSASVPVRVEKW